MKKFFLLALLIVSITPVFSQNDVRYMTTQDFKDKVFDYTTDSVWHYKGDKPCIIDFYADWCGPCKRLAPIMEELAEEHCEKVIFYKVNTDKERELSYYFQIKSIPMLLFVPVNGQPQVARGLLPKETLEQAIQEIFFNR